MGFLFGFLWVTFSSEFSTEILVFERWFVGGGEVRDERSKFVKLLSSW